MAEKSGAKKKKPKTDPSEGKGGKDKLIAIVAAGLVVFIASGGAAAYFTGMLNGLLGIPEAHDTAELEISKPVFVSLPQIRTDLKSGECRAPFLRAAVDVQLAPEDVTRLEEAQAQVMDAVLTHLREQERQNIIGKEGSERLRFELVQIIENIIRPARVHTIYFKELVLQ